MTRAWRRLLRLPAVALALAVLASGCQFSAYDLPLPGSPVDSESAFEITAEFQNAFGVVPRSPVKVNDVTVGEVTEVTRSGWNARVTMDLRPDVKLPDNAIAEVRKTSLLGAKYVALTGPTSGSGRGRLENGDTLPLSGTSRNPSVDEVLGALSFLLSGGGVGQLATITDELNKVMSGRTGRLRKLLGSLEQTVATVDEQKDEIIGALESVNDLTRTLNREKQVIDEALAEIPGAVRVLSNQHDRLISMLDSLDRLGTVGTRVIRASRDNVLQVLRDLRPVLNRLNQAGKSLAPGLALLVSFPFPKESAGIVTGDYANASIRLDISLRNLLPGFYGGQGSGGNASGGGNGGSNGGGAPSLGDLGGMLGLQMSAALKNGATPEDASRRGLLGVNA